MLARCLEPLRTRCAGGRCVAGLITRRSSLTAVMSPLRMHSKRSAGWPTSTASGSGSTRSRPGSVGRDDVCLRACRDHARRSRGRQGPRRRIAGLGRDRTERDPRLSHGHLRVYPRRVADSLRRRARHTRRHRPARPTARGGETGATPAPPASAKLAAPPRSSATSAASDCSPVSSSWRTRRPRCRPAHAARVVYRCFELGLILIYTGRDGNVLELTPPLTISEREVDEALGILEQALAESRAAGRRRQADRVRGLVTGSASEQPPVTNAFERGSGWPSSSRPTGLACLARRGGGRRRRPHRGGRRPGRRVHGALPGAGA